MWPITGIIAAAVVLAIAALQWRRSVTRRRKDVRGLVAILRRDGQQLGKELAAPARWSGTFRFIIRDEEEPSARLDFPQSGFPAYQVQRSGPGQVKLTTPTDGEPYDLILGGPGEVMAHNGLELAFREKRSRTGSTGSTVSARTSHPAPTASIIGPDQPNIRLKDEWL